jgi:hypothetical protein
MRQGTVRVNEMQGKTLEHFLTVVQLIIDGNTDETLQLLI